jgi:glutathione synthase/RimK-type ligase-like ATP-grasp enzyme
MRSREKVVAVYTCRDDPHADLVIDRLHALSANVFRLDTEDLLHGVRIEVRAGIGGVDGEISLADGRSVCFSDIASHYYRRPLPPEPGPEICDAMGRQIIREDGHSLFRQYCAALEGQGYWLSHPLNIRRAEYKLLQLREAVAVGFEIPDTIITQDPELVQKFLARYPAVALKSISGVIYRDQAGTIHALLTRRLTRSDLTNERLELLRHAPVLLQQYVEKRREFRITVVGDEVFPVAMYTQVIPEGREDWRRCGARPLPHERVSLPPHIEAACKRLVCALGLEFGAIDLIERPVGRVFFLEINPNGAWGWCEGRTGLPISLTIARRLAARAELH